MSLDFHPLLAGEWIEPSRPGFWRFRQAIPVAGEEFLTSLGEPLTPLVEVSISGLPVLVKCDHLLPTGSFKDRGAAVLVSRARELGISRVVEDSSGNAGAALAAYCARAGIMAQVYVPAAASGAKLAQIRSYGARVEPVPGTREEAAQAAVRAAQSSYYASHVWNPYFLQGTKTFAYELAEQLDWKAPEILLLPVGNGSLLLGVALGFRELLQARLVSRLPRLVAVQAAACAPLHERWTGRGNRHARAGTVAEGIAIANPPRLEEILAEISLSGGDVMTVTDEEIGRAWTWMGERGFFIEPTSAVVFAALARLASGEKPAGLVATLITGHGSKAAAHGEKTRT